ncbi:hypothetical protein P4133_10840 [Pseudomonas aeruginosa]|nr:hypothetical protein [Pseudomonas aeruginosa]
MDNKPLIKPGKLFLICIALLAYAGLSVALVGGIGPALVSSRDDVLVFAGFAIPGVWLIASVCLGIHLANTRREEAATTSRRKTNEADSRCCNAVPARRPGGLFEGACRQRRRDRQPLRLREGRGGSARSELGATG